MLDEMILILLRVHTVRFFCLVKLEFIFWPFTILRMLEIVNETHRRRTKRVVIIKVELYFNVNQLIESLHFRSFKLFSRALLF